MGELYSRKRDDILIKCYSAYQYHGVIIEVVNIKLILDY